MYTVHRAGGVGGVGGVRAGLLDYYRTYQAKPSL